MPNLSLTRAQIQIIQNALAVVAPLAISSPEYSLMEAIETQTGVCSDDAVRDYTANAVSAWCEGATTAKAEDIFALMGL